MNRLSKRAAFTLVELLVVVGIIAILIGVLLPALKKARDSAKEVQCMSGMRQLGVGFQIYADANNGFLPEDGPGGTNSDPVGRATIKSPAYDSNGNYVPYGIDDTSLWYNAIPPLVGSKSYWNQYQDYRAGKTPLPGGGTNTIFTCPSVDVPSSRFATYPSGYDEITPNPKYSTTAWIAQDGMKYFQLYGKDAQGNYPSTAPRGNFVEYPNFMCYVFNSKLFTTVQATGQQPMNVTSVKLAQLRPGPSVPLIVEKLMQYGEYSVKNNPDIYAWGSKSTTAPGSGDTDVNGYLNNVGQLKATWTRFAARHRKGGFLLFADGHVAWYQWRDVAGQHDANGIISNINVNSANVVWCPFGPTN